MLARMRPELARYGPDPAQAPGPLFGVLRPRLWKSGAAATDPMAGSDEIRRYRTLRTVHVHGADRGMV